MDDERLNRTECEDIQSMFSAWTDNDLEQDNSARLQRHLEQCRRCADELDVFREMIDVIDNLPESLLSRAGSINAIRSLTEGKQSVAPEIMNTEDLLVYMNITEEELDEEIENIPAFEFAGRLKFRKSAIDQWIETRQRERTRGIETANLRAWRAG